MSFSCRGCSQALVLSLAASLGGAAQAALITFDGLPGTGPFSGIVSEAGFVVTVSGMNVDVEGTGKELEALCCTSGGNAVITKSGGGNFIFSSIDVQTEFGTFASVTVTGFLAGIQVGSDVFSTAAGPYFTFPAFSLAGLSVDMLVLNGQRNDIARAAFDNLRLREAVSVPAPGTLALAGLALVAVAGLGRRSA